MKLALVKQTSQAVKQTGKEKAQPAAAAAAAKQRSTGAAAAAGRARADDAGADAPARARAAAADVQQLLRELEQGMGSVMQLYTSLASRDCDVPPERIFQVSEGRSSMYGGSAA